MTNIDMQALAVTSLDSCPVCEQVDFAPYRRSGRWVLMKCRGCGLVALNPQPHEASLRRLYEEPQYFTQRIGKTTTLEAEHMRSANLIPALENLNCLLGRKGRLLEIGSGYGYLLAAAQKSGWETVGLELSPHAASFARQTFGLQIHESPASTLGRLNLGEFDAVLMFSVIEHLPNPLEVLKEVQTSLKAEGVLWGVVPNISSLDRLWHGDAWSGWDLPYHLWHFSPASMRKLCKAAKFGKIKTENRFFNPIDHMKLGIKTRNLLVGGSGRNPNQYNLDQSRKGRHERRASRIFPHYMRRLIKEVFSGRDMNVFAFK